MNRILAGAAVLAAALISLPSAAAFEVAVVEKAPPAEVADAIKEALRPEAVQILDDGKPVYEFWLVKEIALKGAPADAKEALAQVKEVALIGVAVALTDHYDYRDDAVPAGVYTMRFGLQPKDGNHLGTAEFDYFAVLLPAALDQSAEGFPDHDEMIDESSAATEAEHPRILSLRPAVAPDASAPAVNTPIEEETSVGLQADGTGGAKVPFELVFEGHGEL